MPWHILRKTRRWTTHPRHTGVVEDINLFIKPIFGATRNAPLLDHDSMARASSLGPLGNGGIPRDEVCPIARLAHVSMHAHDIKGLAAQRLVEIIELVVAAVLAATNTTRRDLDLGVLADEPLQHVRAPAQPVIRVVRLKQLDCIDHGLVLNVERQDGLAQLAPLLAKRGALIVEDGGQPGVVVGNPGGGPVKAGLVPVLAAVSVAPIGPVDLARIVR